MNDSDLQHLRAAIALAWRARAHGNHPFGAVLVDDHNQVVLQAENTVVTERDCTGHAETNLMRQASQRRVVWPTEVACNTAVQTYIQFHLSHNLGFLDALIAHTAILLGQPLYTFNQKHYAVIPGLTPVQPYARTGTP